MLLLSAGWPSSQQLGGTSEISLLGDNGKVFEVPQLHDITAVHGPMNCGSLPTRGRVVNVARLSAPPEDQATALVDGERR